jgi:hypothetical protein
MKNQGIGLKVVTLGIVVTGGSVTTGWAQGSPKLEFGPVARLGRISVGGAIRVVPIAGLSATANFSQNFGFAGEVTTASRDISRSFEGTFYSYAGPGASREEFERLGVRARASNIYEPRMGASLFAVVHRPVSSRVDIAFQAGGAMRRFSESFDTTVLSVPPGIDPARVQAFFANVDVNRKRTHAGILFGISAPIALNPRLRLSPDFRFVTNGPAHYPYRETSLGVQVLWTLRKG